MPLYERIANYFLDTIQNDGIEGIYEYKFNENRIPIGAIVIGNNPAERNLSLRKSLHSIWMNEPDRRIDLANYYVRTWGHVNGNRQNTIQNYVNTIALVNPPLNKGIASWSKIACIANQNMYAIFDARVSAALNCLQLPPNNGHIQPEYMFPLLKTQSNTVKRYYNYWNENGLSVLFPPIHDNCYVYYLDCLAQAKAFLQQQGYNYSIQHIEMCLFTFN